MSKKDLQTKLRELETIVEQFNDSELSVEQALEKFETGAKLAEAIETDLGELKTKITVLKKRFDQAA